MTLPLPAATLFKRPGGGVESEVSVGPAGSFLDLEPVASVQGVVMIDEGDPGKFAAIADVRFEAAGEVVSQGARVDSIGQLTRLASSIEVRTSHPGSRCPVKHPCNPSR